MKIKIFDRRGGAAENEVVINGWLRREQPNIVGFRSSEAASGAQWTGSIIFLYDDPKFKIKLEDRPMD